MKYTWCVHCNCSTAATAAAADDRIYDSLAFCVIGYTLISFMVLQLNMFTQNINWCMSFVVSDSIISWHCSLSVNMKNGALHQRYGKHTIQHVHIALHIVWWIKKEYLLRGREMRYEKWLKIMEQPNETKQNKSFEATTATKCGFSAAQERDSMSEIQAISQNCFYTIELHWFQSIRIALINRIFIS